ncbi:MAG: RuBisCO accumulation factor 1 [Leptolyngbyaceae cyanobacterium bins.59]|nr:RuBisCO accumulation factor 1 [Leptolyngbyaceae cyanobacterium bins.59]
MMETPQNTPNADTPPAEDLEQLILLLRRKQGTWVEWGQACQTLQKAGYNPQQIFEDTGFEPIQQNQVIVAAQVYGTLIQGGATPEVLVHFERKGSDILYELRVLTQTDRISAAALVLEKSLDVDEAHELAKAVKDFSRLAGLPDGYTNHPGDAIAHQSWKLARQKSDLQERSRLIARGLKFAHSPTARKQIESLLTDFTVVTAKAAPRLPMYRLESEEEMPRLIPVVGRMPLTREDFQAVPLAEEEGAFRLVKFSGMGAWVALPGWQVVVVAEEPVALLCTHQELPTLDGQPGDFLVVIDRAKREWNSYSYYVVDVGGELQVNWFEEAPDLTILGQVILVMRPKNVLEEGTAKDLWQIDE